MTKGRVVKAVASSFSVLTADNNIIKCHVRKKVKNVIDIFVGDYVFVDKNVIEKVEDRKNCLIRPYVSNIDVLIIVVAKVPEPDWLLVEKLLLNCHEEDIKPIICINKCDLLSKEELSKFIEPYKNDVDMLTISAKTGEGLEELKGYFEGKTLAFAGQSAVGKSSIINALSGENLEVGELSAKINRGKNTTRRVEIFPMCGGFVIDTCGFSILETINVRYDELPYYYDEYVKNQGKCKFKSCTHTIEPDCEIKRKVKSGELNADRYARYVVLYNEMKEKYDPSKGGKLR